MAESAQFLVACVAAAEEAATLIMSCGVVQRGNGDKRNVVALAEMANTARLAQPTPKKADAP